MATQKGLLAFSSLFILFLLYCFETSLASPYCTPSACGAIRNISYPFRLKADPKHCGYSGAELACENTYKYYVKEINYRSSSIRLADASINSHTCSFPNSSLSMKIIEYNIFQYQLQSFDRFIYPYPFLHEPLPINLVSCPYPLKNSSVFTLNFTHCASTYSNSSYSNPRYTYIKAGHMNASEVPEKCGVDVIVMTSWKFKDLSNPSLLEIHKSLLYGFELGYYFYGRESSSCTKRAWERFMKVLNGCAYGITKWSKTQVVINRAIRFFFFFFYYIAGVTSTGVCAPVMSIVGFSAVALLFLLNTYRLHLKEYTDDIYFMWKKTNIFDDLLVKCVFIVLGTRFIISPIALWFFIYKFRRRHLYVYNIIKSFLQSDNQLSPIRYSYSDIKKMTRAFKDKLGEGGYNSVYKGKLRSGQDVAVKLLRKIGANGQDFINEISTIGMIHHMNVVKLVGYCTQVYNRALVFDFMPNSSLEKYLFNREGMNSLNLDIKFDIAVGVSLGIEYLHRGCDIHILHFDIKPHNILLDDKFVPKISDFGLAKF